MLALARQVHRETGLSRLCLAGGVALNSVANGRLLRETPFEELFIQPAAGDGGGALGAALYGYHTILGKPRSYNSHTPTHQIFAKVDYIVVKKMHFIESYHMKWQAYRS